MQSSNVRGGTERTGAAPQRGRGHMEQDRDGLATFSVRDLTQTCVDGPVDYLSRGHGGHRAGTTSLPKEGGRAVPALSETPRPAAGRPSPDVFIGFQPSDGHRESRARPPLVHAPTPGLGRPLRAHDFEGRGNLGVAPGSIGLPLRAPSLGTRGKRPLPTVMDPDPVPLHFHHPPPATA